MKTKQQKQEEAQARQEASDKLTPLQKIQNLNTAGHTAVKQRTRLTRSIAK